MLKAYTQIWYGDLYQDTPVWFAEPLHLVAEWRCFVRYGQILDVRPYKGNWRSHFTPTVLEQALAAYLPSALAAFALEIGCTADGKTVVVEGTKAMRWVLIA
ncbi:ATP-grasp domain-containing protein [Hymenobacter sp. BT683]|uniref:ATP-grasp domain-containing protein n=1 Tax=Hymenobacter jeongseonensis TaxID=2791027 RepID=A0ABS0IKQ4_9BACT|nr:ATP-grasp domain-containing protein [Hymenobacter jeongseonensis]